ncbi:MAG: lipopolysaccharide biosynthesis protein [Spirochaetes bacterium]|nr:lipopolysaccharide biosynthesis protein [Spirochaetota bacterium]
MKNDVKSKNSDSINKNIKKSLIWNSGTKFFIQFQSVFFSIVLARLLDPKDFGIFAIGLIIINYTNIATNFGFKSALVQKENVNAKLINSVFFVDFSVSVVFTIGILLLSNPIADLFNSPESAGVLKLLSVFFIITSFSGIMEVLLKREMAFKKLSGIHFIENLVGYSVAILLAIFGYGYWALVFSRLASKGLSLILLSFKTNWFPLIEYSHKEMKQIYGFGFWSFLRAQLVYINQYYLHFLTGLYMNQTVLGSFDKAFELSKKPMESFGKPINSVMFSTFSNLQKKQKQLNNWFINMVTIQTVFIVPFYIGLICTAPIFIPVLFGTNWNLAIVPLQLLCIGRILGVYNGGFASFNIGVGDYKNHTLSLFFVSFLFVITGTISVKMFGMVGLCLSFVFIAFIRTLLVFRLALQSITLKFHHILIRIFPYLLANSILFICVEIYLQSNSKIDLYTLINSILIGIFCYVIPVIISNFFLKKHWLFPLNQVLNKKNI